MHSARPLSTGHGEFELHFFHANYPAGVHDKQYRLRTILRTASYLAAAVTDSPRIVVFQPVSREWLRDRFDFVVPADEDIGRWLETRV